MEEIDLRELFEFFINKISLLIVITVGVCLLGSLYGLFIQKPMYSSYTTVILGGTDTTITQSDITMNKNLVNTDELSLDMDYGSLVGQISVSAVNNTEIIKITVNNEDGVVAKNIANMTATIFTDEIVNLYNMENVNILDEAIVTNKPYNINVVKQIIIYFMIGFILATGILFVIYYFDRTIKSVEQVEQKIKLPILGSVQDNSKCGK